MAVRSFYFDEMMSRIAAEQLIKREYTVVMAVDVDMVKKDDIAEHLRYATQRQLVVVTFDREFAGRTSKRTDHAGLICLSGPQDNIGYIVRTVSDFADIYAPEDTIGHVFWF
jgi:hypothetical protein